MLLFKFDPNHVHKVQNQKLLLLSTLPDKDEVFEFEGLSCKLLSELIGKNHFSFATAETILKQYQDDTKDLATLWNFCLEKKIIIPVT